MPVATISSVETAATLGSTPISTDVKISTGKRRLVGADQEDRHRHIVERGDEGEERAGDEARPDQRQGDEPEGLEAAGAEHARGLLDGEIEPDRLASAERTT